MNTIFKRTLGLLLSGTLFLSALAAFSGCTDNNTAQSSSVSAISSETVNTEAVSTETQYSYSEYPLSRNGIDLHLDCIKVKDTSPTRNILLIHGVTYSSHEFDIDYKDYSLVGRLAREGYAVWRLDIAGFGQSGEVTDGFMPDSDYAAEDINAAVEKITKESGQDKIDILGWSWGTVTVSRYAAKYSDHLNRLVLYAPILSGLGEYEVHEDFHHNTWEHAADDFQRYENDIHLDMKINIAQAALGAEIEVPTVDGPEKLRIPAGTQPGKIITMKGKGIPALRGGTRGDEKVIVDVVTPTNLTDEQRNLFEKLAVSLGTDTSVGGKTTFWDRLKEVISGESL